MRWLRENVAVVGLGIAVLKLALSGYNWVTAVDAHLRNTDRLVEELRAAQTRRPNR